jgi:hypothetical protein
MRILQAASALLMVPAATYLLAFISVLCSLMVPAATYLLAFISVLCSLHRSFPVVIYLLTLIPLLFSLSSLITLLLLLEVEVGSACLSFHRVINYFIDEGQSIVGFVRSGHCSPVTDIIASHIPMVYFQYFTGIGIS